MGFEDELSRAPTGDEEEMMDRAPTGGSGAQEIGNQIQTFQSELEQSKIHSKFQPVK